MATGARDEDNTVFKGLVSDMQKNRSMFTSLV